MGTLTAVVKPERLMISWSLYRDQTEALWPGSDLRNMGFKPDTRPRNIRTNGHIYLVYESTRDEDIPEDKRHLVKRHKFSKTGNGRIKLPKKGYKVRKDKNRRAIGKYRVPAKRLMWAWDIHVPTEWLEKDKIRNEPISMIQEKRNKQTFKGNDMPKRKTKGTKSRGIEDIKKALDDLEDIGVGIGDIIAEGVLTKDMIKQYLDDFFEPADEE